MQETYIYTVITMNGDILKILELLESSKVPVLYKDITDLLNEDEHITYFVNRSFNSFRIYNTRYNCHIYNIFYTELDDFIIIEKIVSL